MKICKVTGSKLAKSQVEKLYLLIHVREWRDSFVSHREFCEALAQAVTIKHQPAMSSKGVGSSSSNQLSHMNESFPQLDQTSQISLMIKPSMGSNPYNTSQAPFMPSTYQSNQDKYEPSSDTMFFTNLMNTNTMPRENNFSFIGSNMNFGNEGTSMVIGDGNVSDLSTAHYLLSHTRAMPQLPATTLLQKAALIGSTSSSNTATNFAGCYANSSSSIPTNGNKYEKGKFLFGSEIFGNSDSNGHDSKMIELLNSFSSSGAGSSIYNPSSGAAYGQEESRSGGYDNTWKLHSSEEQHQPGNTLWNMGIQQSTGVRFTRDFLGVGEEMVPDMRSDRPQIGRSFL